MTQIGPVGEGTGTSAESANSDLRREVLDQTVVIVAGADDKFALGLTVALFSAVRHLDPRRGCPCVRAGRRSESQQS
jgi:hypothetical protein